MKEISPPNDLNFNKIVLPMEIYQKILKQLSEFEYELGKFENVAKHILDNDIESALEDSIPMFSHFLLCAGEAGEKEEYFEETLKTLELGGVKDPDKKVTIQKGEIRRSELYRNALKAHLRWKRIRKNCEGMMKAMLARADIARTKSVNQRPGQRSDSWNNQI